MEDGLLQARVKVPCSNFITLSRGVGERDRKTPSYYVAGPGLGRECTVDRTTRLLTVKSLLHSKVY